MKHENYRGVSHIQVNGIELCRCVWVKQDDNTGLGEGISVMCTSMTRDKALIGVIHLLAMNPEYKPGDIQVVDGACQAIQNESEV